RPQSAGQPLCAAARALDGRTDSAVRGRGAGRLSIRAGPGIYAASALVPRLSSRPRTSGFSLDGQERSGAASALAAAWPSHEKTAQPHAGRNRVPIGIRRSRSVEVPRAFPLYVRAFRTAVHGLLSARRIDFQSVRRKLQLAWPDLDAGQLSPHRVVAGIPSLLWRRFQGRMPDAFRTVSHAHGSGFGAVKTPMSPVPARSGG